MCVVKQELAFQSNQHVRDLDTTQPTTADWRWLQWLLPVPRRAIGHRHHDGFPSQPHALCADIDGATTIAIDTTMVSPLNCTGSPHALYADIDGATTMAAPRKQRRFPEWPVGLDYRGSWSLRVRSLSKFKARDEPPLLQQRVRHAWLSPLVLSKTKTGKKNEDSGPTDVVDSKRNHGKSGSDLHL